MMAKLRHRVLWHCWRRAQRASLLGDEGWCLLGCNVRGVVGHISGHFDDVEDAHAVGLAGWLGGILAVVGEGGEGLEAEEWCLA